MLSYVLASQFQEEEEEEEEEEELRINQVPITAR